jgi:hypothetical protein
MMMLGREISLFAELMFWSPGKTGQPEGEQYIGELQTSISIIVGCEYHPLQLYSIQIRGQLF